MKRMLSILLFTLALTACTPAPDSEVSQAAELPYAEGQLYAAAWLGWQETGDLSRYAEFCPEIENVPVLHLSDGEYWLILPRYPHTRLEVSQLDINTSQARLVYSDPDCEALILQCNVSDIFPDALIQLHCEEGDAQLSPYISLRDGSVVLGPEGLDLTHTH